MIDELKKLWDKLDTIDDKVSASLNERILLTLEIGKVKYKRKLSIGDSAREEYVLQGSVWS